MKQLFMKRILVAGLISMLIPASLLAQKEKEKVKTKSDDHQTIVITRSGNKDEKTVIEISGDKIKINGKDADESKDVRVNVNTTKGSNSYSRVMTPGGFNYSITDVHPSYFNEDSNRAMLGVVTEGNDKGAEINSVSKESAAAKAGLQKGDIITKIGNKKIEDTDDVTEAVRAHKPGDKVNINFLRDGKEQTVIAELGKWKGIQMNAVTVPRLKELNKMNEFRELVDTDRLDFNNAYFFGRPKLGLSIQDTDDGKGVKVLDVDDDSNAAKAGVQKDDIITHIDDKPVTSADEVSKAIREKKDASTYRLQVLRSGKSQNIEVKIPRKLKTVDL